MKNKKNDYDTFIETVNNIVDKCPDEDKEAIANDLKELYFESKDINRTPLYKKTS